MAKQRNVPLTLVGVMVPLASRTMSAADVPSGVGAVAGSPEHAALFALPRQPAVYPTVSGLVRVVDWTTPAQPLHPLYLRRPDAKPRESGVSK